MGQIMAKNINLYSRISIDSWQLKLLLALAWLKVTKTELTCAANLFQEIDKNYFGNISTVDLKAFIECTIDYVEMGDEAWERAVSYLSGKNTHQIGFFEFVPLCLNLQKLVTKDATKELFVLYSSDVGHITIKKLSRVLKDDTIPKDREFLSYEDFEKILIDLSSKFTF